MAGGDGFQIEGMTQLAFSVSENKGVYALLLGSGISRSAEIPTGWEITTDLIRRVAAATGVKEQADWGKWYSKKTGKNPDYSELLATLATTPAERRAILHSYIEPDEQDREQGLKVPTKAHVAIADLVVTGHIKVIVTTNFDRLLETALRARGVEPTVVASVDTLLGAEPISHSDCYVLKLHGDYKDARLLNTEDELGNYPEQYDALLDRILDEYGLIICGWSGDWDLALRKAMLRAPSRRYSNYWLTRGVPQDAAKELIQQRGARLIKIKSADAFFGELRDKVQTIEQARKINPASIDLLIASAKRFLTKAEFRIQLEDLVSREFEELVRKLDAIKVEEAPNPATITSHARNLEAACEGISKLAGVLGRWGDGSELPIVIDLIKAAYDWATKPGGSGFTVWVHFREYPAVLISTAYGMGLVRAHRWRHLYRVFNVNLSRDHREPTTIVHTLYSGAWDGSSNDIWRKYEGLDRYKTAFSCHMLSVFEDWGPSFMGMRADLELVFDRLEFLAALAIFSHEQFDLLEASRERNRSSGQQYAYVPLARYGWHSNREKLAREIQNGELTASLLEAGFAQGKSEMIDMFLETTSHLARRLSWG